MKAWHFTADKLRDGQPIPAIGEKLVHEGELKLCVTGLHASLDPYDALKFAPGCMLHHVEMGGEIVHEGDKLAARERTIVATADATGVLREYARWCALQVIHLWGAPAVVHEHLNTGDQTLADAAYADADAATHAATHADAATHAATRVAAYATAYATAHAATHAATHAAADATHAVYATRVAQRAKFNELVNELFSLKLIEGAAWQV